MSMDAIQRFITRVRAAKQSRSKDVRMSLDEAQDLSSAIGELLATHVTKLQTQPKEETITVSVDGGGFKK